MNSLKLKKGDNVLVISGKDKGKKGKIITTNAEAGKVIVEGVNMATVHQKPRKAGETGGIVTKEAAIAACKVMVVCPKCHKPTRVKTDVSASGEKSRVCKACGATL